MNKDKITYDGRTLTPTEWARIVGVSPTTILRRMAKDLPVEAILSSGRVAKEFYQRDVSGELITYNDITLRLSEWAEKIGVHLDTLKHRYLQGYSAEDILKVGCFESGGNRRLLLTINGVSHSVSKWAELTGLNGNTIRQRFRKGDRGVDLIRDSRKEKGNAKLVYTKDSR